MTPESFALLAKAFAIGVSVAAPIGPVNVEIIRRGLTVGARSAFLLGLGAVSADCVYLGLSLTATSFAAALGESSLGTRIGFARKPPRPSPDSTIISRLPLSTTSL